MTLRVAQFFLKIAHLSFSMGLRGPRAYGLRPRLWLLVELYVFPRLGPVVRFPALDIGCIYSRASHRFRPNYKNPDFLGIFRKL